MKKMLLLLFFAPPVLAAAKIDAVTVKPGAKPSDVEIAVRVTRGGPDCDARVDYGDGRGEVLEFGLATTRTLRHTYRTGGTFTVTVKGAGRRPCEGTRDLTVTVTMDGK